MGAAKPGDERMSWFGRTITFSYNNKIPNP